MGAYLAAQKLKLRGRLKANQMITLAHYKGAAISYRLAAKRAKSPEVKRGFTRAAVYTQRRINQIERRVLVKTKVG
jgi:hypothetical protein